MLLRILLYIANNFNYYTESRLDQVILKLLSTLRKIVFLFFFKCLPHKPKSIENFQKYYLICAFIYFIYPCLKDKLFVGITSLFLNTRLWNSIVFILGMYLNSSAKVQGFVDYFKFNGYTVFFSLNCPLFGQNVYKKGYNWQWWFNTYIKIILKYS